MRGFRVYDKVEKRMIPEPAGENIFLSGNGNLVDASNFCVLLADRYIRLDETGLKDKNGKDVYEGDVLEIPEATYYGPDDKWMPGRMLVEWGDHYETTDDRGGYIQSYGFHFFEFNHTDAFVCGNIYEDPTLMDWREPDEDHKSPIYFIMGGFRNLGEGNPI